MRSGKNRDREASRAWASRSAASLARRLRRERAVAKVMGIFVNTAGPEDLEQRLYSVAKSLQTHVVCSGLAGRTFHNAADAVQAARPALPDQEFRSHRRTVQVAGRAKHDGLGPPAGLLEAATKGPMGDQARAFPPGSTPIWAVELEMQLAQEAGAAAQQVVAEAVARAEPAAPQAVTSLADDIGIPAADTFGGWASLQAAKLPEEGDEDATCVLAALGVALGTQEHEGKELSQGGGDPQEAEGTQVQPAQPAEAGELADRETLAALLEEQSCVAALGDDESCRGPMEDQRHEGLSESSMRAGQDEHRQLRFQAEVEVVKYQKGERENSRPVFVSAAAAAVLCPDGHTLERTETLQRAAFVCDECGDDIEPGLADVPQVFLFCDGCDFARCGSCAVQATGGIKRWRKKLGDDPCFVRLSNNEVKKECIDALLARSSKSS